MTYEEMIAIVAARQTSFNSGILTADKYVDTLQDCVGSKLCYRYGSTKGVSFEDVRRKAANTLTFNNPDMVVRDAYHDIKTLPAEQNIEAIELPKNTLMAFRHVLTTPRQDRDGDILRTGGAKADPKMLLLWQHVHTLPIGKMLRVVKHDAEEMVVDSAIVDMNELAHDSAVMIDNDMGRFSHGFRATNFTAIKSPDGKAKGFDVKDFEIMEESLVSVPANPDAEMVGVFLDLIEGDKLQSSMMKSFGKKLRLDSKSTTVAGGLDLKGNSDADGHKCSCDGKGTEAGDQSPEEGSKGSGDEDGKGSDSKDEKMMCPKCGKGKMVDGKCTECGYSAGTKEEDKSEDDDDHEDEKMLCSKCKGKIVGGKCSKCGAAVMQTKDDDEKSLDLDDKAGRVLSKSNLQLLRDAADDVKDLHGNHISTRSGIALASKCYGTLERVLEKAQKEEGKSIDDFSGDELAVMMRAKGGKLATKEAAAMFIANASAVERRHMKTVLETLESIDQRAAETKELAPLLT